MTWVSTLWHASTAAGGDELQALERAVTTPLPVRRRIGVVALAQHQGCERAAVEVAAMLARLRDQQVLLVRAASHPLAAAAAGAGTAADAPGIRSLVISADAGASAVSRWWEQAGDLHRDHELTITDWGARSLEEIVDIASDSHALCLVSNASRDRISAVHDVADALEPLVPTVVCAVEDEREAVPATRTLVRRLTVPAALLNHRGMDRVRGRDARDLLRLCAALMRSVASSRPALEATP